VADRGFARRPRRRRGLRSRPYSDLGEFLSGNGTKQSPVAKNQDRLHKKHCQIEHYFPKLAPSDTETAISAASAERPGKATQDADHVS
jgi:hypothetical protein